MSFQDKLEDDLVKILVIGDASVGKTSFIQRYVNGSFSEEYKCTLGFDCITKVIEKHGGRKCCLKLQLWDIAGQDRFPLLTRAYYKYARGCILMFDLTDADSFSNVLKWKKALDSNTEDGQRCIPCFLVANKVDLPNRVITYEQIEELCQTINAVQWTETSVKDGTNVHEAITYLLDVILDRSPSVYMPSDYEFVDVVDLNGTEKCPVKKKTCKVCS